MEEDTPLDRIAMVLAVLLLLAAIMGVCPGCATTSDLDRIHARIEEVSAVVADARLDCSKLEAVEASVAAARTETERVSSEVQRRGSLLSQYALEIIAASVGVAVPGATALTNALRNRARRQRGEPVKIEEVVA